MKHLSLKLKLILAFVFALNFTSSQAQDFTNSGVYFEYVSKEFKAISKEMWDYTSAAAHGKSARKVENKRKEVITQIGSAITNINKIPGFNGSREYKDSVLSYLKLCKLVMNEDYAKIVDMEEVSEQSYDLMEAYLLAKEMANKKQKAAGEMVQVEQRKFASNNNIKLIESQDDISKKLEEASKVYKYYNEVYLIFFKSYKQEIYLLDALNKNDINALEQNRSALQQTSTEGKQKLQGIKDFKGDLSLKMATNELLVFYEKESDKFVDLVNFYIQKDKFEKIKAALDAKKEKDRTKEDIDLYNKSVNEYNLSTNKFNTINNELNQNRSRLINKWNETGERMLDRFVPKK